MSFINWGEESAEQRAIRARLEQDALYEQAARIARTKMAQSAAANPCVPAKGVTLTSATTIPEVEKFNIFFTWTGLDENDKDRFETIFQGEIGGDAVGAQIKWNPISNKWNFTIGEDTVFAESNDLHYGWDVIFSLPEAPFANPVRVQCGNWQQRSICSQLMIEGSPSVHYYGNQIEAIYAGETLPYFYLGLLTIGFVGPELGWLVDLVDFGFGVYPIGGSLRVMPYGTYELEPGVTLTLSKGTCQIN